MLRNRIIPFLLFDKKEDCIKTIQFQNRRYIGDILNNIRIFNEKKVDELAIFDIDATVLRSGINYELLKKIASISRMPLTYGGGIDNIEKMNKIIKLGIEKISINSSSLNDIDIISTAVKEIGSQSVSVCINYKKVDNDYYIVNNTGQIIDKKILDYIDQIQNCGVGEIILNSYLNDGQMKGYDLNFVKYISKFISTPLVIIGGCSNLENIKQLLRIGSHISAGCSSLFIYKGIYNAVLINYPSEKKKEYLFN